MNAVKKKRILLADDEELVRNTLRRALEEDGHEVVEVVGGADVLRTDCSKIDLIVMDVVMPEGDGIEAMTELRKTMPNLPVIAMSGVGRAGSYLKIMDALGATTMLKPFSGKELLVTVNECLSGKPRNLDPS